MDSLDYKKGLLEGFLLAHDAPDIIRSVLTELCGENNAHTPSKPTPPAATTKNTVLTCYDDQIDQWIELIKKGHTAAEVEQRFSLSQNAVSQTFYRKGIKIREIREEAEKERKAKRSEDEFIGGSVNSEIGHAASNFKPLEKNNDDDTSSPSHAPALLENTSVPKFVEGTRTDEDGNTVKVCAPGYAWGITPQKNIKDIG